MQPPLLSLTTPPLNGRYHVSIRVNLDVNLWLDFTDPEVSQLFTNKMQSGYPFVINGMNNHSDFQDMQFNFNQGWIFRKA